MAVLHVQVPSTTLQGVFVWRALELTGLAQSVRHAKGLVRGGITFVNSQKSGIRDSVRVGEIFTIEVRFSPTRVKSRDVFLANYYFPKTSHPRSIEPLKIYNQR